MASAPGSAEEATAAPMEDVGGSNKRDEPDLKKNKNFTQIMSEILAAGRRGYCEAEKKEHMKNESKIQAEDDKAVLSHKIPKEEEKKEE
eukprot:8127565-Karenia_brevis.AAC.1